MKNTNLTAEKLTHFLRDVERQCESNESTEDRVRRIRNVIRSWRQQEWESAQQQASLEKLKQIDNEMKVKCEPPEHIFDLDKVL